jgi:uncharacterized membrane protein (DUF2068 family)
VAVALIVFGLAKLVAAAAMWEGQVWGGYLLAATVALLVPAQPPIGVVRPPGPTEIAGRGTPQ